jgi:c(7)-type cytochrome triheme protein
MRYLIALYVLSVAALGVLAQEKKPPLKLVFEAKVGNVTFDHAAHVKREKNDCKVCHDKLFPQEKAPLNFKAGMHKPAEAGHTSCGACHTPGGAAFETKGNCNKCHVKAAAK